MDVTDQQRTTLTDELNRLLGAEATTILMAHLPRGGVEALATREDIAALRAEMATKDDLARFATKDDLARLDSKVDLFRSEMEATLRGMATRAELTDLRDHTDRGFAKIDDAFHVLIECMTSLEGRVEVMGQSFRAEVRGELLAAITSQTRALIISLISALAIVSALAFAVASNVQP